MSTRVRFAPSPTGRLHVGGARTALFNLLFARNTGGTMILRIEDTDQVRSSAEAEQSILDDLRWLGILWDEGPDIGGPVGPYRQTERAARYQEVLQALVASGRAYAAWDSNEELAALRRQAELDKRDFRYRQRPLTAAQIDAYKAEGRVPVWRLRCSGRDIAFTDQILEDVSVKAEDLEDFVLVKSDGLPTYHFAVVVDDHDMAVTHVIRAQEHLLNTVKHLAIYDALGWSPPSHAHVPLIFSMDGRKMSKRDKARVAREQAIAAKISAAELAARSGLSVDQVASFLNKESDDVLLAEAIGLVVGAELPEIEVVDFRRAGYLPEALVNFLVLLGWSPGDDRELMGFDEVVASFGLDRVGKTAARFDRDKLKWMNGETIKRATPERMVAALRAFVAVNGGVLSGASDAQLAALAAMYQPRARTLRELAEMARFFFVRPETWGPEKAIRKHIFKGDPDGVAALRAAQSALAALPTWDEAAIDGAVAALAAASFGGELGRVAQPLRIAVSGTPVSPPIGPTLALLGRDETMARIEGCLGFLASLTP